MEDIQGTFLFKKDKRGAVMVAKESCGRYLIRLLSDKPGTGTYTVMAESGLSREGSQYRTELRAPDGHVVPVDVETIPDGVRLTFVYSSESDPSSGMDEVDVYEYRRVPGETVGVALQ